MLSNLGSGSGGGGSACLSVCLSSHVTSLPSAWFGPNFIVPG